MAKDDANLEDAPRGGGRPTTSSTDADEIADEITAVQQPLPGLIEESKPVVLSLPDPDPVILTGPTAGRRAAGVGASFSTSPAERMFASGSSEPLPPLVTGGPLALPPLHRADPVPPLRQPPAGGAVGSSAARATPVTTPAPAATVSEAAVAAVAVAAEAAEDDLDEGPSVPQASPAEPAFAARAPHPPVAGARQELSAPSKALAPARRVPALLTPPAPSAPRTAARRDGPRRRGLRTALGLVAALAAATAGFFAWRLLEPAPGTGRLEISTIPADAVVTVGDQRIGDHSPVVLTRPPGAYAITIARDGYIGVTQTIDMRAGQSAVLPIVLAPSTDTLIAIESEPAGAPVWLDGALLVGPVDPAGGALQKFRVDPGKHVLEIRGGAHHKPWREEVELEAGATRSFHVRLTAKKTRAEPRAAAELEPEPEAPQPPPPALQPSQPAMPATALTPPSAAGGSRAAAGATGLAATESAREVITSRRERAGARRADASTRSPGARASEPGAASAAVTAPPPPSPAAAPTPARATAEPAAPAAATEERAVVAEPPTISGRLARELLSIDPNADEHRVKLPPALARAGMKPVAVVKLCVSAQGTVSQVRILKSADAAVDPQLASVLGRWRYRPLLVGGQPAAFCYVLRHELSAP